MKITSRHRYSKLVKGLVIQRKAAEITQSQLAQNLYLDQSTVSRYEQEELQFDIDLLFQWCVAIDFTIEDALSYAGYIDIGIDNSIVPEVVAPPPNTTNETAYPVGSEETENGFNLILRWRDDKFFIPFPASSIVIFRGIESTISEMFSALNSKSNKKSNRDAISEALMLAISQMPEANPSDIYHHIVYRLYLREYNKTDPKQSWARAGGEGVELFFKSYYTPLLAPYGISIQLAFQAQAKNKFLIEMGLADQIAGRSKLDVGLYGTGSAGLIPFGGVHVKASLAERVSDDKPCSERMMAAGFKSYLFTFDAKSFPPPNGKLVNVGELGTIDSPSDKRGYVETHGSFDAFFSYNSRTTPSGPTTQSGKRIYTSRFDISDALVETVSADWQLWKKTRNL
jgi:transcriptional regulator with XRE-family HTH domain